MSDVVEITGQKAASIPVIDIAPLRSKSRDERLAVARQIGEAAQDMGFFYIANHGVSPDLVASAFRLAKEFFSLPLEEKMRLVPPEAHPGRGPRGGGRGDEHQRHDEQAGLHHEVEEALGHAGQRVGACSDSAIT